MRISRLVIRNFRNFQHFDVAIQPGVTCVLGENNTGKTNLLHALRVLLDVNLPSYFRQFTESDLHCCTELNEPQQSLISAEFTDYADNPEECAMCGLWEVSPNLARITFRFRPRERVREAVERGERQQNELNSDDYHWEFSAGTSGADNDPSTVEWDEQCGYSIRFQELQAFKVDFLPALRDVESDLRHSRISPLNRLLTVLDLPQEEKDALVQIIRDANDEVENSPTIHDAGETVATSFRESAGEVFALPLRLGMVSPTFTSIVRSLTVLLTDGPVVDFEPSRNGLGLNNLLYVSMLLEYFRRRTTRPDTAGQLLLIEEPEAHLHPQLQRVLYAKLRDSHFQTFVTTHSTHISSASPFNSFVMLTDTGDMATASTSAAAIPNLTDPNKADLERYLDATRSTLLFARKVLLVEGPAELFLIPPLVKQVMGIDLERQGISVVPIHGVHFDCYAKLFCEEGLRKKCAIVTDGDLVPSDGVVAAEDEDADDTPTVLRGDSLRDFENDYLRVFSCETTFERTLAMPGLLPVLEGTATELNAPNVRRRISAAIEVLQTEGPTPEEPLAELDVAILNTAKRFGKARFAQIASKYVHFATEIPAYIRDAVTWLTQNGPNH